MQVPRHVVPTVILAGLLSTRYVLAASPTSVDSTASFSDCSVPPTVTPGLESDFWIQVITSNPPEFSSDFPRPDSPIRIDEGYYPTENNETQHFDRTIISEIFYPRNGFTMISGILNGGSRGDPCQFLPNELPGYTFPGFSPLIWRTYDEAGFFHNLLEFQVVKVCTSSNHTERYLRVRKEGTNDRKYILLISPLFAGTVKGDKHPELILDEE